MQTRADELKWYVRQYIGLGLRVLPLWGISRQADGATTCLCGSPECDRNKGKHPLTTPELRSGVNSATDDLALLDRVIEQHPDMNIGIAVPDGMVVVDVDPRNGGEATVDEIEARYGKFPDTWDQLTGGGGRHLCFQVPFGMRFSGKLGPGVDIKQAGGYIVVEPSVHAHGKSYEWEASSNPIEGQEISRAPDWLERIGGRPSQADVGRAMKTFDIDQITKQDLESALAYVDSDDRDDWIKIGMALKTIGDVGFDIWDRWSQRSSKYKAGETAEKWYGFKPKILTASADDTSRKVDYRSVFAMAQSNGWINSAKQRSKASKSNVVHIGPMADEFTDDETGEIRPAREPLFEHVGEKLGTLRRPQWVIERYIEWDGLSVLFGPSGVGKSFVVISMACCVATGTPWFGMPVRKGPVFYIAGEGHNGLMRRFKAWSVESGVSLADAPLYKSRKAVQILDAESAGVLREEIERMAEKYGAPVMVIIDTLARNFGDGDENAAKDIGRYVAVLDEIRAQYKCHIMSVHHSGHNQDRARGSSALKAAMDQEIGVAGVAGHIAMKVTKMKDEETPIPKMFKLKQMIIGTDDIGEEVKGAALVADGDPMDVEIGSNVAGKVVTARMLVDSMRQHGWQGYEVLQMNFSVGHSTARRMVERCVNDLGYLQKDGKGFALTDKALEDPMTVIDQKIDKALGMD
jgi:hypothetical protein